MSIGSTVRRLFGRHETFIAEAWRSAFVDLDELVRHIREWVPAPLTILEIGCGEGAGTQRLAAAFPGARILAIDITDRLGRLYAGRTVGVEFRQTTVQDLAVEMPHGFDLVVMCDVLHHIPPPMRQEILSAAGRLMKPGGSFVFKDWERRATPIHWISHAADRWLTGDKVDYLTRSEAERLVSKSFGQSALVRGTTIKPWRNNFALHLRPEA